MIGAIKRRWKSTKKAKVLHKGGELSASNDICPTSRGFTLVDSSPDDFNDKMIKPPSPRQIHPVLEKGSCSEAGSNKYGQLPPLPPSALNGRKSFSGIDESKVPSTSPPPPPPPTGFIHVNSGRIELVSNRFTKDQQQQQQQLPQESKLVWRNNGPCLIKGGNKGNDAIRHSWCGSVFRGGMDVTHPRKALLEDHRNNFHHQPIQPPPPPVQQQQNTLTATLLNPLKDRLTAIEDLTKGLQTQQTQTQLDFQQCLSELAAQVSKAVAIHGAMKSEVDKLHSRMVSLENHNKAMTSMIIPTLIKLQETITTSKEKPLRKNNKLEPGQKTPTTNKSPEQQVGERGSRNNPRRTTKEPTSSQSLSKRSIHLARESSNKYGAAARNKVECRIPRMSNESRTPTTTPNGSNKSIASNDSTKGKSELIKSSLTSSRLENNSSLSQSSSSGGDNNKKLLGRIPRRTRLEPHPPPPTPPSSSKLPVRRTIAAKHPAATSRSLPNHTSKPPDPSSPLKSGIRQRVSGIPIHKSGLQTTNNKLGSAGRVTGGAKDEGYSTMSSEALVLEQDSPPANLPTVLPPGDSKGQPQANKTPPTKDKRLHKSNTFNTFREIGSPISIHNKVVIPASLSPTKANFTTIATLSILQPASITTTSDNVRIIRGRPYDIQFDDSTHSTDPSSSATVLWEDSDDSDILFLPIEMSSEESGGCDSESTLIPTSYASWTMSSGEHNAAASTTPTPKTAEQRELVEKWMRLEDVRQESQWEEEWAWDWDGVVDRSTKPPPPNIVISEVADEDEEFWFASQSQKLMESSSGGIVASEASAGSQIDSSTWTRSKGNPKETVAVLDEGKEAVETEELPPPVVEFTREFYRLANYGSNLSFIDSSPAARRGRTSPAGQSDISVDDKIIQTDFTNNSSLENMSVSSDLFAECRNCLEIMKKLVGSTSESDVEVSTGGIMNLSDFERRLAELTNEGDEDGCSSSPTAWVSVPKGVTSTEVDKILEILSSSESEDVNSPGP